MECVMSDRKSKDAIEQMNEALRLMDASVKELRSVVLDLRAGEIEIVDGDKNDENE